VEIFKIYLRSLRLIRTEKALTLLLMTAGVGVASAQLLEPVLFGRVIDSLTKDAGFARYLGFGGGWVPSMRP